MKVLYPFALAKKRLGRIFNSRLSKILILVLLTTLFSFHLIIELPITQTYLTDSLSKYFTKVTGFPVSIGKIYIGVHNLTTTIDSIIIYDPEQNEMINIEQVEVHFNFLSLVMRRKKDILISKLVFQKPRIVLLWQEGRLNIDRWIDILKNFPSSSSNQNKTTPHAVKVKHILIQNGYFNLHIDDIEPDTSVRFYPKNIALTNINADITDFRLGDTIESNIHSLNALEEHAQLPIHQFSAFFQLSEKKMLFKNLYAEIGESILKDSLAFIYENGVQDFSQFNEKIYISASLNQSIINFKNLSLFFPLMKKYADVVYISGDFKGNLSNYQLKDLTLSFGERSFLSGNARFIGLPDWKEAFMDLDMKRSFLSSEDLKKYISPENASTIHIFDTTLFTARFTGFINNFTLNGNFKTGLGFFKADVSLNTQQNKYKGEIHTKNFDIGRLLHVKEVGKIDMKGYIEGEHLSIDEADFILNADIDLLEIDGYAYRNIITQSHLKKKLFEGKLTVKDKKLSMEISGKIDFEDSTFKFDTRLDSASLDIKNFPSIVLQTNISADFKGLDPERIHGKLELLNTHMRYKENNLSIDSFLLTTYLYPEENTRDIIILSDLFTFNLHGKFSFESTYRYIDTLYKSYIYSLSRTKLDTLFSTVPFLSENSKLDAFSFSLMCKNLQPIFKWLEYDFTLSRNAKIEGKVHLGRSADISLKAESDTFIAHNASLFFYNNQITFGLSKDKDKNHFLHDILFSSQNQKIGNIPANGFTGIAYRENNNFVLNAYVKLDSSDFVNLTAYLDIFPNHYDIEISDSRFKIGNKLWRNDEKASITIYQNNDIIVKDLIFKSDDQSIYLDGKASFDSTALLSLNLRNIDINSFSSYLPVDTLEGKATVTILAQDIYKNRHIYSEIDIQDIVYKNFLFGNVKATLKWRNNNLQIVDAQLLQEEFTLIKTNGSFYAADDTSFLDLNIFLELAPLNLMAPFVKGSISNIQGLALGHLNLSGNREKIKFRGDILLDEGKIHIDYLNTSYSFNDNIKFKDNQIQFKNFRLKDENEQYAYLNGHMKLTYGKGIYIDIEGNTENFRVLNTSSDDNSTYYGTAITTSDFTLVGTGNNLSLDIEARAERGTKIYVPVQSGQNTQKYDFITFIKPDTLSESLSKVSQWNKPTMNINLQLDITPDVYCEVIFDKQTRDIVRGQGGGKLRVYTNTEGDFEIYGDIKILKGTYNFTIFNIVDKKFEIEPNSYIRWSGDPYSAKIDLTASYKQLASLNPIIDEANLQDIDISEMRKRYPVDVLLKMTGSMLEPKINFDIDIHDYPTIISFPNGSLSLESYVAAFNQKILTDEKELNIQVFSLIVFKKFSPIGSFTGISASDLAVNSVSELLTNQLGYWLSQVDENLEIGIDLGTIDKDALNNLQLNLSYTFLDGRLKISRNGAFTDPQQNRFLFGDIVLEYLLTQGGKYRIKVYRKESTYTFETGTGIQSGTGGASLLYTTSFEKIKNKKKKFSGQ